ncbi:hypothetical protein, partial [Streptomyces zhihengii]
RALQGLGFGGEWAVGAILVAVGAVAVLIGSPGSRNIARRGSRSLPVVSPDDFRCSDLSGDSPATVPPP